MKDRTRLRDRERVGNERQAVDDGRPMDDRLVRRAILDAGNREEGQSRTEDRGAARLQARSVSQTAS